MKTLRNIRKELKKNESLCMVFKMPKECNGNFTMTAESVKEVAKLVFIAPKLGDKLF